MPTDSIPSALGNATANAGQTALAFLGDPAILVIGIVFVIAAILVLYFVKQIIINSILGIIGWALLNYAFQVQLPFWASLMVSLVFGLAGLGAMLVLRFLGMV